MRWNVRRRPRARVAAVIAGVALLLCGCASSPQATRPTTPDPTASTATAAAPSSSPTSTWGGVSYVALGDSYSSGVGGGDAAGACGVSPNAFPVRLAALDGLDLSAFPACAGATTDDVLDHQVGALGPSVGLVTITIGGNDLDVATLPTVCSHGETATCKAAVDRSVSLLHSLPARLLAVYRAIARAAPHARIYVADYPAFYDLPDFDSRSVDTAQLPAALAVDAAVSSLDATIANAVATARKAGADIRFVDVSFTGHGVNSPSPWFVLHGPNAYHPTAAGYRAYAETLRTAIG